MNAELRACAVVPTLDNPRTVRRVVEGLRAHDLDVLLVDDGSGPEGRAACAALAAEGLATLARFEKNRGKGAAVLEGFRLARVRGFTHAFQVDADLQHDLERVPTFLEAARERPDALILAYPTYGPDAPRIRRVARKLTAFWVAVELGSRATIVDAMIGFRVYPLAATSAIEKSGLRMEFDVEAAVRMARAGTPTLNLPVHVRYPRPEEGGVSHFRPVRDNLRLSWFHTRMCTALCFERIGKLAAGILR